MRSSLLNLLIKNASQEDLNEIYKMHKERFLISHAKYSVKHYKSTDLERAFVTQQGVQYYRFPNNVSMPLNRMGKVYTYQTWMMRGLSPEEETKCLDAMERALHEGLTSKKGAAKIGAIVSAMRERKDMTIHTELLYNFLAVQYIRFDEDPEQINQDVHEQKIREFKHEVEVDGNHGFFFAMRELKTLLKHLDMSEAEWKLFFTESLTKQEALSQWLSKLV
jgi:hypothetical protein